MSTPSSRLMQRHGLRFPLRWLPWPYLLRFYAQVIVKEAFDSVGSKDDKVVAGFIKVLTVCVLSCGLHALAALPLAEEVR